MISLLPYIANSFWQISSKRAWSLFNQNAQKIKCVQENRLHHIIQTNKYSRFGKQYGFNKVHSPHDFQRQVPLATYKDYYPWIKQAAAGEENVLTCEPIMLFELSSGSIAASKLIPYTSSLKQEFNLGIGAWIYNLFQHYPGLKDGEAYWSISPITKKKDFTSGDIPIGFEEDSSYLGKIGSLLEHFVMAVPKDLQKIDNIENHRYLTLLHLLNREKLKIISVWSPTFLTQLLVPLEKWWDQLIVDIEYGSLNLPQPLASTHPVKTMSKLKANSSRASILRDIVPGDYPAIWPNLQVISCWMSGPAKPYAKRLQSQFNHIVFQPKGLIATEAFISFPLVGYPGSCLAITGHFFEFIPLGTTTQGPLLADQLEIGQQYEIVVTTSGGLYRYKMHDIIEIVGFYKQVPLIEFISKSNHISDFFGEKLNEAFVADICQRLFQLNQIDPLFYLLAPQDAATEFHYTLYIETEDLCEFDALAQQLEKELCKNFHYNYARKLGQLAPAKIKLVPVGSEHKYQEFFRLQGMRLGNIKPMRLSNKPGWDEFFV